MMNKAILICLSLFYTGFFTTSAQQNLQVGSNGHTSQNTLVACISPGSFVKAYGGPQDELLYGMCTTLDGGFLLTGQTQSYGAGNLDGFILKINSLGEIEWSKTYGGSNLERGFCIIENNDGTLITSGYTESFGSGGLDIYLLKLDATGNIIWSSSYGAGGADYPRALDHTLEGGYVMGGITTQGAGANDFIVIKTDNMGNRIWSKSYGNEANEFLHDLHTTPDSGFIASGYRRDYTNNEQAYLLKVDKNGNTEWSKTYSGPANERGGSVTVLSDGYLIVGYTESYGAGSRDVLVIKVDNNGNTIWSKAVGGNGFDQGGDGVQKSNGNIILSLRATIPSAGNLDMGVIELDSDGNYLGGKIVSGLSGDELSYSGNSNLYLTGSDALVASGFTNSIGSGGFDAFLVKSDCGGDWCSSGDYSPTITNINPTVENVYPTVFNHTFNAVSAPVIDAVAPMEDSLHCEVTPTPCDLSASFSSSEDTVSINSTVFFTNLSDVGDYTWTINGQLFSSEKDPSYTFTSPGNYVIRLYVTDGSGCNSIDIKTVVVLDKLAPPPADALFIPNIITPNEDDQNSAFRIRGIYEPYTLEIFNKWGKRLHRQENYDNKWNADELSDGMYFYQITTESSQTYKGWVQVLR